MTHSEHVHIFFGIGLAITGALWLAAQVPAAARLRYVWPVWLFAVGFFLVIPTETQERTYTQVGAWGTFVSVFPNSFAVWLVTVQKFHVIQHKIGGVCAMGAAAVEEARAFGRLAAPRWRWALPLLTVGAGLALGVHGGSHQHLPHLVEQEHHWFLGGCLVLGGIVQAVATARGAERRAWYAVLPALVLLAGLDLALFYRVH